MQINQIPTEKVEEANSEEQVESIVVDYWVSLNDALVRLKENEDFKTLILEGYLKDKAVKGVSMLATDYVKQGGHRPDVMEQLVAISQLQDYFEMVSQLGTIDPESPVDDEE